jgi:hypothetical protein
MTWEGIKLICLGCGLVIRATVVSTSDPYYPVVIVCECGQGMICDSSTSPVRKLTSSDIIGLRESNPKECALIESNIGRVGSIS